MPIYSQGTTLRIMTDAERVRAAADPYAMALAKMAWRDNNHYRVIFHLQDGSTVTFKKVYQLEDDLA